MEDQSFTRKHLKNLIDKYLKGTADQKEIEFLEAYYDQFNMFPDFTDALTNDEKEELKEKMKSAIIKQISTKETPVIPLWRRAMRVAAAVVLIAGLGATAWLYTNTSKTDTVAVVDLKIVVPLGETRDVYLPDGSIVTLNSNSSLEYQSDFQDSTREVHLTGEGYFDIAHNPEQPFIVHSGNIKTRVLGTAFNIKAYPGEEEIAVTVTRGKVRVEESSSPLSGGSRGVDRGVWGVILLPNQQIAYNTTSGEFIQNTLETKGVIAWKPAEYRMDNLTMAQVAKMIETRFNKEVEFKNENIPYCYITATFYEHDPIDELLEVICTVAGCHYYIVNDRVVIDGDGCSESN